MLRSSDNPDRGRRTRTVCAASDAKRELAEGSEQARILETVKGADDTARYLAERFNGMRAQLGVYIELMRSGRDVADKFVKAAGALTCGDYGMLLDKTSFLGETFDVEDAGLFAQKLRDAAGLVKFERRLQACCELNDLIDKAISGWRSKIEKMRERSLQSGATQAEMNVAAKKIVQFEEAIKILRKRGGEVTSLYYETKRAILGLVDEADKRFKAINWHDPVGKVNLVRD